MTTTATEASDVSNVTFGVTGTMEVALVTTNADGNSQPSRPGASVNSLRLRYKRSGPRGSPTDESPGPEAVAHAAARTATDTDALINTRITSQVKILECVARE